MPKLQYHMPVMANEALEHLNLSSGLTVVDATVGTGGHSLKILEQILPGGRLIGIDRDARSLAVAQERLSSYAGSCSFVHGNFSQLDKILERVQAQKVDGIIFDLGISTFQLQDPERGFSFQSEGPLDMRMDNESYVSAYDLVNNLNEDEISHLLWNFGQERWHNRIAHLLVQERQRHPISTTRELADIVVRSIPSRYRYKHYRIHPATRTFQAVRIAVNRELEILEESLNKGIEALKPHGRMCVISFHSLEDRVAKFAFRKAQAAGLAEIITPKPMTPSQEEVNSNPASRSSKLRVIERL